MVVELEKRKKFLPCVVHRTKKEGFKLYVFPNKNIFVNVTRSKGQPEKVHQQATSIFNLEDGTRTFKTEIYIPIPPKPNSSEEANNNVSPKFVTTLEVKVADSSNQEELFQ